MDSLTLSDGYVWTPGGLLIASSIGVSRCQSLASSHRDKNVGEKTH